MYSSIELGAGRDRFGDKFFPTCLETDVNRGISDSTDIDVLTDAHKVACKDSEFSIVLVCNPYPYGFVREEGVALLREIVRILEPNGRIVLIASSHNPNCQPNRITKAAKALLDETGIELSMMVTSIHAHEHFPGHTFYRLDGSCTIPNLEIVLTRKGEAR